MVRWLLSKNGMALYALFSTGHVSHERLLGRPLVSQIYVVAICDVTYLIPANHGALDKASPIRLAKKTEVSRRQPNALKTKQLSLWLKTVGTERSLLYGVLTKNVNFFSVWGDFVVRLLMNPTKCFSVKEIVPTRENYVLVISVIRAKLWFVQRDKIRLLFFRHWPFHTVSNDFGFSWLWCLFSCVGWFWKSMLLLP